MAIDIVFDLLGRWAALFAAPLKDFSMLWIIIPLYLNWIFSEFYQEKKGTSFGNAITNGVTLLWVGADWGKTTMQMVQAGQIAFDATFALKILIAFLTLGYGLLIIILGVKLSKLEKYLGRVRVITYFALMATPIFYGVVAPEFLTIAAMLLFAPLFYIVIEMVDRVMPSPRTYDEDSMPSLGASMPSDTSFGLPAGQQMPDLGGAGGLGGQSSFGGAGGLPKF